MSAPFSPEQEARLREIVREEVDASTPKLVGSSFRFDGPWEDDPLKAYVDRLAVKARAAKCRDAHGQTGAPHE